MRSSYIAIEFHATGPSHLSTVLERIRGVPATELISKRSREVPWYERNSPGELACRVILWVHGALEVSEVDDPRQQLDPYRGQDGADVELEVPSALAEVIAEIHGGAGSIVERGRLRFTTRRYEERVRDQLRADVEATAGNLARGQFGVERRRLVARVEGTIPKIHELEQLVARSGLVDPEAILVDYL